MPPLLQRWLSFCIVAAFCLYTLYRFQNRPFFLSSSAHQQSPLQPHFEWKNVPHRYPVESFIPLPSGQPRNVPKVQHAFEPEDAVRRAERKSRLDAIRAAFMHSWGGYKKHAWLQDEVKPLTGGVNNPFGGWAATLVDTLDLLWIMGLEQEFAVAVRALKNIDFTTASVNDLNVFETTIRYLGGFLGAYDVCDGKYPELLEKAVQVGEMLYVAFDTPNRMPITRWQWQLAALGRPQEASVQVLSAEIGSLTLEFTRLSQLTGDPKYYDAVQRIMDHFEQQQNTTKIPGLWPLVVNANSGEFNQFSQFTLGGMADSLYEYLPKEYLMLGGLNDQYRVMYETMIEAAKDNIFFRPMTEDPDLDVLLSGSAKVSSDDATGKTTSILEPLAQHLACFTGGMAALGARIFDRPDDMSIARKLVDGCIWAYRSTPSGIMPEIFHVAPCASKKLCPWDEKEWQRQVSILAKEKHGVGLLRDEEDVHKFIIDKKLPPGFTDVDDSRYSLRPEAIESIFIVYRITGDPKLQDVAWKMWETIDKACRCDIAYAAITNVMAERSPKYDSMESFWTAETLKYFYLIFSEPDVVDLDTYVFNTEAHPLKRPRPS